MPDSRRTPSARPTRRTLLITGAAVAAGATAGSVVSLLREPPQPEAVCTSHTTVPSTSPPESIWQERDQRFLKDLTPAAEKLPIAATFRGAFPSVKLRDVLPLEGLGAATAPWVAATIIGPENQLQIMRTGESSPSFLLSIPPEKHGEILSMAWDPRRRTLYLSAGGLLWAWRHDRPQEIAELAEVPGASTLYELLVDAHGFVWGGTFPSGSVFHYNPTTAKVRTYSQLAADSQYVRRLSMDGNGRLWVGTGALNPRLFTFLRSSPEEREEIPHPDPIENGFISALRAGTSKVLMTSDGHPDIFELDVRTRTWRTRINASGWLRTPSAAILHDDTFYMSDGRQLRALTPASSAVVAEIAESEPRSIHSVVDTLLVAAPVKNGFSLQSVSPALNQAEAPRTVTLDPGRFRVQSLLAPSDGMVYVGGFMGSSIAGINPDTDQRWRSPDDVDLIHQIESMIEIDAEQIYLGTYSWADVISWDVSARDDPESYERVVRLSNPYRQSRPFGLASNSTSLFVGTVPNYGLSGGVLAKIDVTDNTVDWVLDGDGLGLVEDHSIVGLVADEKYVYGTTSVRNGSGTPDTEGPARVFMLDIETRKKVWETAPVTSAGALYTPQLVAGWLLIADLEGINVIDPRNGRVEARHRLGPASNTSQRPGWASAEITTIDDGRRIAHAAAGVVTVADFLSATSVRAEGTTFGTRVATSRTGRVFAASNGTDVVEISMAPTSQG